MQSSQASQLRTNVSQMKLLKKFNDKITDISLTFFVFHRMASSVSLVNLYFDGEFADC